MVDIEGVSWWTREDVAGFLGISPDTVSSYVSRGQMPAPELPGRSPYWRESTIRAWHAERRGRGWRAGEA